MVWDWNHLQRLQRSQKAKSRHAARFWLTSNALRQPMLLLVITITWQVTRVKLHSHTEVRDWPRRRVVVFRKTAQSHMLNMRGRMSAQIDRPRPRRQERQRRRGEPGWSFSPWRFRTSCVLCQF